MAEQTKSQPNKGYLYPNERQNDRQPHYRGKLNVEGKEYNISAWVRDDTGMLSISLTDPATLPAPGARAAAGGNPGSAPAPASGPSAPASGMGDIWDDLPG